MMTSSRGDVASGMSCSEGRIATLDRALRSCFRARRVEPRRARTGFRNEKTLDPGFHRFPRGSILRVGCAPTRPARKQDGRGAGREPERQPGKDRPGVQVWLVLLFMLITVAFALIQFPRPFQNTEAVSTESPVSAVSPPVASPGNAQ
jgi:hypothetical protein